MSMKASNRREFLKSSTAMGVSLGIAGSATWNARAAAASQNRPNIVFICTDQQRIDDMSCAGNPYVKTPAADALAARGTRFSRSYCSFPLCSPSRATHVTSRMPYEIGINRNSLWLPKGLPSMGTLFKQAGYRTVWTGKWHLPSSYPTDQSEIPGFEVLFDAGGATAEAPAKARKARPQGEAAKDPEGQEAGGKGTQADPHTLNAAVRFLKGKPPEPFALVVSYLNPHDICGFNEKTPKTLNLPTDLSKLPPVAANLNAPDLGPASGGRPQGQSTNAKKHNSGLQWNDLTWRQEFYRYYQLTERVDRLIGDVLKTLRDAGLEENTVVLYTSDHGEMAGSHRRIRKMSLYREAMEVPFIIAGPGVPRGMTDKTHLVSGLDVLPTLCDFAGIAPPPQTRGLSVKKILDNPNAPWRDAVFGALGESSGRTARTERYKYDLYAGNKEELFDLQADPGETKNLAGDPSMAGTLEAHRKLLHDWMEKTADPFGKPADEKAPQPAARGGAAKAKGGKRGKQAAE